MKYLRRVNYKKKNKKNGIVFQHVYIYIYIVWLDLRTSRVRAAEYSGKARNEARKRGGEDVQQPLLDTLAVPRRAAPPVRWNE